MGQFGALSGTEWWRATDYDVVGGTHVAPSEGTTFERYDPFRDHDEFWGGRRRKGGEPPYVALARIDPNDAEQILGWCHQFGLLGILPQRTLEVFFWPRWEEAQLPTGGGIGLVGAIGGSGMLSGAKPIQLQYRQGHDVSTVMGSHFPDTSIEIGAPLTSEQLQAALSRNPNLPAGVVTPSTRVVRPHDGTVKTTTVADGYATFFPREPDVVRWTAWSTRGKAFHRGAKVSLSEAKAQEIEVSLEQREYPTPFRTGFLLAYGEPLRLFQRYQRILTKNLRFWEAAAEVEDLSAYDELLRGDDTQSDSLGFPASFQASLHPVTPGARPVQSERRGMKWTRRWWTPSLFAALHVMMLQDFAFGGAFSKHCQTCGQVFVSDDERQLYCSDRCQKTAQMRRYRKEKSEHDQEKTGDP